MKSSWATTRAGSRPTARPNEDGSTSIGTTRRLTSGTWLMKLSSARSTGAGACAKWITGAPVGPCSAAQASVSALVVTTTSASSRLSRADVWPARNSERYGEATGGTARAYRNATTELATCRRRTRTRRSAIATAPYGSFESTSQAALTRRLTGPVPSGPGR